MQKFQIVVGLQLITPQLLCILLLTGCYSNNAQYFSNSSMKMVHHTTILNHQTNRLVDAANQNSSNVNFEYEEIITQ